MTLEERVTQLEADLKALREFLSEVLGVPAENETLEAQHQRFLRRISAGKKG